MSSGTLRTLYHRLGRPRNISHMGRVVQHILMRLAHGTPPRKIRLLLYSYLAFPHGCMYRAFEALVHPCTLSLFVPKEQGQHAIPGFSLFHPFPYCYNFIVFIIHDLSTFLPRSFFWLLSCCTPTGSNILARGGAAAYGGHDVLISHQLTSWILRAQP